MNGGSKVGEKTASAAYSVRRAQSSDIVVMVGYRLALQEYLESCNRYLIPMPEARKNSLYDKYAALLHDNSSYPVVVVHNAGGYMVGMGVGVVSSQDVPGVVTGRIDDVWIEPGHRRQGLCRLLVRELLAFFCEQNAEHVVLDYVIGAEESERTWRALGFKPVLAKASITREALAAELEPS